MTSSDSTRRLEAIFRAAVRSADARAWLFHFDNVDPSSALHSSSVAPALLQMRFHSFQRIEPYHSVPAMRDVLVVVKDSYIPLIAPFGIFGDPLGPTLALLGQEPAFESSDRHIARAVLVPDPDPSVRGSVYVNFTWKASGVLCISTKSFSHASQPRAAPTLSQMLCRFLAVKDATALRVAAYTALQMKLSAEAFAAATIPLLTPPMAKYWEMLAFDSRAQSPCLFCFARGIAPCECPTPLSRRARRERTVVQTGEQVPPMCFSDIVASAMRNDSSGLILATWRAIPEKPKMGRRAAAVVIGTTVAPYDVVFGHGTAAGDVVQNVVGRTERPAKLMITAEPKPTRNASQEVQRQNKENLAGQVLDVSVISSWNDSAIGGTGVTVTSSRSSLRANDGKGAVKRRRVETSLEESAVSIEGNGGEHAEGYECPHCKSFISRELAELTQHVLENHGERRQFRCVMPKCGQMFSSNPNLKRHMTTIHEGRPCACELCRATFKEKTALEKHVRIAHVEKKNTHTCPHCGCSFGRRGVLVRHMNRRHPKDMTSADANAMLAFQCFAIGCGTRFQKWIELERHVETSHDGCPFQCAECGAAFRAEYGLSVHIREKHCVGGRSQGRAMECNTNNTPGNIVLDGAPANAVREATQ